MAMKIVREMCSECHLCAEACPTQGIQWCKEAGPRGGYEVVPGLCTECAGHAESPRCVAVCPSEAIETVPVA